MESKHKSSGWKNFFAVLGIIFVILFLWSLFSSVKKATETIVNIVEGDKKLDKDLVKDVAVKRETVQENIKQNIVWVKYEVSGKNEDGSYFESGGTGSGVIVRNEDNELTIYTNRHVVDCEYNEINCFQRISENIKFRTQDGNMHNVDKVSFSKSDIDLAILTTRISNSEDYSFAYYTDKFDINDEVISVGY